MTKKHPYELGKGVDYTFSARYKLPRLKKVQLLERLKKAVIDRSDPYLPLIGMVIGEGEDTLRDEVVFDLDPSRTWGTPRPEKIGVFVHQITQKYNWQQVPEELPAVRIPLGRRVGYDVFNEVSMEQTRAYFRAAGRQALRLTVGDLFSIRSLPGRQPWFYREPGVMVDIDRPQFEDNALEDVLAIAAQMHQFRVVPSITGVRTQVYQLPKDAQRPPVSGNEG